MKFRHSRNQKTQGNREAKSWLQYLSFSLLIGWLVFVVFCWHEGLLNGTGSIPVVQPVQPDKMSSQTSSVSNVSTTTITAKLTEVGTTLRNPQIKPVSSKKKTVGGHGDYVMHVVFSTDCNPFQDWQTLLLFHSALVVKQPGFVTRIASGCDEKKQTHLSALYAKLYTSFNAHFTPDFRKDANTNQNYAYYNKPRGLRHWLDNANPPIGDNVIVALIDPDMIFLRPLTAQIRGMANNIFDKKIKDEEIFERVVEGRPAGQLYGLGAPWTDDKHKKFNRTIICGVGSPCLKVEKKFGEKHYSVGPPYILHRNDAERIAETWTSFAPVVYNNGYPFLLAEMYAYSMAAAHENLPHLQTEHHMVSNVDSVGEGWPWVDKLQHNCLPPIDGIYFKGQPLPTLLHYCQGYRIGGHGFGKRGAPENMFSCASPMFKEPPNDLDRSPIKTKWKIEQNNINDMKRSAFSICIVHRSLNAALIDYKQRMCGPAKEFVNFNKTLNNP